jgi:hypothetical protein
VGPFDTAGEFVEICGRERQAVQLLNGCPQPADVIVAPVLREVGFGLGGGTWRGVHPPAVTVVKDARQRHADVLRGRQMMAVRVDGFDRLEVVDDLLFRHGVGCSFL